ncbi:MAG: lipid-A-disaccharide synthase [Opitutaceae bacterium]|nr:lipid-A-disaccharide synthase [Opitutaceae bacterium]|tara:strand:+ start:7283 stop:8467 length:1185 start_codon:yes stop_codon:yes gene_type:complete
MSYVPELPEKLDAPMVGKVDLLVIAGEHSGDEHAAVLVKNLLSERPELRVATVGGPLLQKAGAQLLFDLTHMSVVGFIEVLKHYKYFKQLFQKIIDWIEAYSPQAVLFVDYPGFNLRLTKALNKIGVAKKAGGNTALLYYIAPQVWAWKEGRKYEMGKLLDSLSVIFPFEVEVFADTGLATTYVGHPFLQHKQDCELVYNAEAPVLLLGGSRISNVKRVLPILLRTYELYLNNAGKKSATIVYPSETVRSEIEKILEDFPESKSRVSLSKNEGRIEASAVLTPSGTMSLRCALAGIPGRIVHAIHPLTYLMGRAVVNVPFIGIANLLLNRSFYPEFTQQKAKPKVLAGELARCLEDPHVIHLAQQDCKELRQLLDQEIGARPWQWLSQYLQVAH